MEGRGLSNPEGKSSYEYSEQVEEITSVLYPADDTEEGKYLRLKQQYLFSAAGVLHAVRKHKKNYSTMEQFHVYNTFQINDTHPTLVILELMRYLMDEEKYSFDKAWDITTKTCAYTNHTIMAEALEKWNVEIMETLLPRIYQIIQEINLHFKAMIEKKNGKENLIKKMQIIEDSVIKMAHLAIVGSYSVNGVAELHTEILKNIEMKEFNDFFAGKFNNKTNGITHRRWCLYTNLELVSILKETLSDEWIHQPSALDNLLKYRDDREILYKLKQMKLARKEALAKKIYQVKA